MVTQSQFTKVLEETLGGQTPITEDDGIIVKHSNICWEFRRSTEKNNLVAQARAIWAANYKKRLTELSDMPYKNTIFHLAWSRAVLCQNYNTGINLLCRIYKYTREEINSYIEIEKVNINKSKYYLLYL